MTSYDSLLTELRSIALLESCGHVLGWDEQTYMPPGGAEHRANQLSLLAGMVHERATSPQLGDLLASAEQNEKPNDPDSPTAANLREARRKYDRSTKLPRRLVEELSRVCTLSQQAWVQARKDSKFADFLPWLEQVVALRREEADVVGYGDGVPYDALLDEYEPGMTAAEVTTLFAGLRDELVPLIAEIVDSGRQPDISILQRNYPVEKQRDFGTAAATAIGFDFHKGRLDEAAHPFCSGFGPGDTRLTTRYDEHHFPGSFFGTLHEAGHGIYEQGLNPAEFGTPMGTYTSLGIHESQSRLWENFVGRSRAFWNHYYSAAQQTFSTALTDVSEETFLWCVNDVRPTFIRVEADEATYNLHILLRFELEQPLVSGDLKPADVPTAWNEKFTQYFGITPPTDAMGCLQDIHWSGGGIGYFPTYSLGNMYAAQFFEAARRDLGDLDEQFAAGDFAPLKTWLNQNIHQRGQQYRANRLVEVVTGERLAYQPLVKHLRAKFSELYGL
ncbi:Thermostable carboxypeptidase 1 [Symmachiella dynata]|uniref:carboxypeptidase M32 n=1 Tax=Symmachiella dynata TaxID=2527995 RepID=UPI0011894883|nr:carboxypeptidase M32 [Symmachiella dynata]QDT49445.1 Thermostable carboxypeptidase 1 [Symmachiella dynata]